MSIPTVVIRVEFPAYSDAFDVEVPATSTVLDVKQAISSVCAGNPQPEGQRVIWRGRYLDDRENISELWQSADDQRIVHLSVQPSAWNGGPPDAITSYSSLSTPPSINDGSLTGLEHSSSSVSLPGPAPADKLAYVRYKHSQALYHLSGSKLPSPNPLEDTEMKRTEARLALQRMGYAWPGILDTPFPSAEPTPTNALDYDIVIIDGKSYLSRLTTSSTPTPSPSQVHALKILTYTFSIFSLPLPQASLAPTSTVPDTSSVPPHVNDLLRQLGLPPLRAVPNANIDVAVQPDVADAPALLEQAEGAVIREIPIRALLAPLLMVVFRTVLLLYFFSPTRKPLLGLCLIAWIVYEMWTHVRIAILRPPERVGANGAANNGVQAGGGPDAAPVVPPAAGRGNDRNPPGPGGRVPNTDAIRDDQQVQGPPIPMQSSGIIDSLALTNIYDENKLLWPLNQPLRSPPPPTFFHKASSFLSLLAATLHPEVYNRRRAALRRREGRLRTEMNAIGREVETRNDGEPLNEEEHRRQVFRQQLQLQHSHRATWVKQYIDRVRADDWIDE